MKPIPLHAPTRSFRHGSLGSYAAGLGLSLLLTAASFGVVMAGLLPHGAALAAIVGLAVLQLVVQLGFFLHLGGTHDRRSDTVIFGCTALLIAIVVAGSLWVTRNANANMMPTTVSPARAMGGS